MSPEGHVWTSNLAPSAACLQVCLLETEAGRDENDAHFGF